MESIIVIGINGFVGHHLAKELYLQGFKVIGVGREAYLDNSLKEYVQTYYSCDLLNMAAVKNIPLEKTTAIINLAGLAQQGNSFSQESRYISVNTKVQTVLAQQLLNTGNYTTRLLAISSGAVYEANQKMPLSEKSKTLINGSPYAKSKLAMEDGLEFYAKAGVNLVVVRPFNHIGPGQIDGFLVPDLINQLNRSDAIAAGNLTTKRDYTDVRDVVRAYILLATKKTLSYSLYNVCSEKPVSGERILDLILHKLSKSDIKVTIDKKKIRPDDPPLIYGSAKRLNAETGWKPMIDLKTTINDCIDFYNL
jgi:GDP-4-dehydro-6-deoxy-D-mannose reductase